MYTVTLLSHHNNTTLITLYTLSKHISKHYTSLYTFNIQITISFATSRLNTLSTLTLYSHHITSLYRSHHLPLLFDSLYSYVRAYIIPALNTIIITLLLYRC